MGAICATGHYLVVAKVGERLSVSKQAKQSFHIKNNFCEELEYAGLWSIHHLVSANDIS